MAEPTIVVRHGDLDAMIAAMGTAKTSLETTVSQARSDAASTMSGWTEQSESRTAQLAYDAKLETETADLLGALDGIKTALTQVQQAAHEAEVRCVAIMD